MKKNKLNKVKEERKVDINDPIVFIEEDSALTRKRIISYPFNKEKKSFTLEEMAKKSNKTHTHKHRNNVLFYPPMKNILQKAAKKQKNKQ